MLPLRRPNDDSVHPRRSIFIVFRCDHSDTRRRRAYYACLSYATASEIFTRRVRRRPHRKLVVGRIRYFILVAVARVVFACKTMLLYDNDGSVFLRRANAKTIKRKKKPFRRKFWRAKQKKNKKTHYFPLAAPPPRGRRCTKYYRFACDVAAATSSSAAAGIPARPLARRTAVQWPRHVYQMPRSVVRPSQSFSTAAVVLCVRACTASSGGTRHKTRVYVLHRRVWSRFFSSSDFSIRLPFFFFFDRFQ